MRTICEQAVKRNDISFVFSYCEKGVGSSVSDFKDSLSIPGTGFIYFLMQGDKVVFIGASGNRFIIGSQRKTKEFDGFYSFMSYDNECGQLHRLLVDNFYTIYNCNGASSGNKKKRVWKSTQAKRDLQKEIFDK